MPKTITQELPQTFAEAFLRMKRLVYPPLLADSHTKCSYASLHKASILASLPTVRNSAFNGFGIGNEVLDIPSNTAFFNSRLAWT